MELPGPFRLGPFWFHSRTLSFPLPPVSDHVSRAKVCGLRLTREIPSFVRTKILRPLSSRLPPIPPLHLLSRVRPLRSFDRSSQTRLRTEVSPFLLCPSLRPPSTLSAPWSCTWWLQRLGCFDDLHKPCALLSPSFSTSMAPGSPNDSHFFADDSGPPFPSSPPGPSEVFPLRGASFGLALEPRQLDLG